MELTGAPERALTDASNALTARWLRAAVTGSESTVISGACLWPLLAILAGSADGAAREELASAAGIDADGALAAAGWLLDALRGSVAVNAAVGVWSKAEIPIRDSWMRAMPAGSWAQLRGDTDDRRRLDAWASEQTHGHIETMPVELDDRTLMVLATALAVETRWRAPFAVSELWAKEGPWAGREHHYASLDRTTRELGDVALFEAAEAGTVTVADVHGEDGISVRLVLGAPDADPGAVAAAGIASVGAASLRRVSDLETAEGELGPGLRGVLVPAHSADQPPVVALRTVAFEMTSDHDLTDNSRLFGLTTACDGRSGHFPAISASPLAIQRAHQSAMAAFTDRGFVAAAVTTVQMMAGMSLPLNRALVVHATFDRPFAYVAYQRTTGLALVAGWVATPMTVSSSR